MAGHLAPTGESRVIGALGVPRFIQDGEARPRLGGTPRLLLREARPLSPPRKGVRRLGAALVRLPDEAAAPLPRRDEPMEALPITRALQPTGDPVPREDVRPPLLTSPLLTGTGAVVVLHAATGDVSGVWERLRGAEDGATTRGALPPAVPPAPPTRDTGSGAVAAARRPVVRPEGLPTHIHTVPTAPAPCPPNGVATPCILVRHAEAAEAPDGVLAVPRAVRGVVMRATRRDQTVREGDRRPHSRAAWRPTPCAGLPGGVGLRQGQAEDCQFKKTD